MYKHELRYLNVENDELINHVIFNILWRLGFVLYTIKTISFLFSMRLYKYGYFILKKNNIENLEDRQDPHFQLIWYIQKTRSNKILGKLVGIHMNLFNMIREKVMVHTKQTNNPWYLMRSRKYTITKSFNFQNICMVNDYFCHNTLFSVGMCIKTEPKNRIQNRTKVQK